MTTPGQITHDPTCRKNLRNGANYLVQLKQKVTGGYQRLEGEGNEELLFNGYEVSAMQDEKVLEICYATLFLHCDYVILTILYCTPKILSRELIRSFYHN